MQVVVALVVIVAAIAAGLVLRARRHVDAPTQPRAEVPTQLDRADFPSVTTPWLVVAFTSASCTTCADVARKVAVLGSDQVGVVEAEYLASRALHAKYAIDAVPIVAIADVDGVVVAGFAGPVTATDLWAAVARVRDPNWVDPHDTHDHP